MQNIFIKWKTMIYPIEISRRFSDALSAAMIREKGVHGSVGTQNEQLIHSTLKNYYAPYCDDQEIKIGKFFADAVNEDGIFEIQTRSLHKLREKLKTFLDCSHVTVVHPVIREYRTLYIREQSGEVVKETPPRKIKTLLKVFKELYSIRDFLLHENLTVILCGLRVEKRAYFSGETPPDMSSRSARKKCVIENIPLELLCETVLEKPLDYEVFLTPDLRGKLADMSNGFTKKDLCKAANESASSLRLEVLRTVGLIEKTGKNGREFVYKLVERNSR